MVLSNKVYDALKWVALVLLPALASFYLALSASWNLPHPTEIAATIAALDIFLAALIGVSTSNYKIRAATVGFNIRDAFGSPETGWILPLIWYEVLTWIAQIFLPAFAAFYFALSGVWGLPYTEQVVATVTALDTFLGILLGFSTAQFHKQAAIECMDHPAGMSPIVK